MKPTHTLLITTALTLLMTGCSTEEKEKGDNTIAGTFTEITFNNGSDKVLLDNKQNLTWVNDIGGCFAGVANMNGTYCSDLNFAGSTNWRYPTSKELSSLFIRAKAEGVSLEYIVAGCAYATASDGYVQTENTMDAGKIQSENPGGSGVRCVTEDAMQPFQFNGWNDTLVSSTPSFPYSIPHHSRIILQARKYTQSSFVTISWVLQLSISIPIVVLRLRRSTSICHCFL